MTRVLVELGVAVAKLVVGAVADAVRRPSKPPEPIPFGRHHAWGYGLTDPPVCAYCDEVMRNDAHNRDELCRGPKPLPRAKL